MCAEYLMAYWNDNYATGEDSDVLNWLEWSDSYSKHWNLSVRVFDV